MLDRVKPHVDRYLAARNLPPAGDRLLVLDSSKGSVDGTCFLIFDPAGVPVVVAKAARTVRGRAVFDAEYEILESLDRQGMNDGARRTPSPLGRAVEGDLLITLQTALPGTLLKNVPGRRLFAAGRIAETLAAVLDWWHRFQQAAGVPCAILDAAGYERDVLDPVRRFLEAYETSAGERALLDRCFERRRALAGLDLPRMVRHGDFCPANMVLGAGGIAVFDWEFPLVHRLPLFDLFYFFASTRHPHAGLRGESKHFASFEAMFWGAGRLPAAMRSTLAAVAGRYAVPRDVLGDLFLLCLVEVALMKRHSCLEAAGLDPALPGCDAVARDALRRFDVDEPFARLRGGRLENLACVAGRGLPAF